MNKNALIKLSLLSVTIAIVLSLISLLFMNRFMSQQGARFRDDFLRFYAASLEQKLEPYSLEQIRQKKDLLTMDQSFLPPLPPPGEMMMPPPPPMGPPPPHRGPRDHRPPPHMDFDAWIVTEAGEVIAFKRSRTLPANWNSLPHPKSSKQIETTENFFRIGTEIVVLRLENKTPLYLVVRGQERPMLGNLIFIQAVLTSSMIVIALILAMLALFLYMRRKSEEARSVLRRLEEGDLKARFTIHRLDEFGGLMLDFNRMAEEIEKLVGRIHTTERTRKQLLQEMGHDLRTPLTSLKTSFETLQTHYDRISEEERQNLFEVLVREIDYFKDLIEQLMTIASLDEPHFKASTEQIDVQNLLMQEIRHHQRTDSPIQWKLHVDSSAHPNPVLGDGHLIQRLLRNGMENARRHANSKVDIHMTQKSDHLIIEICDDGPGADLDALNSFGKRREFRGRKITKDGHFSLGLGSVIMKAIAELHNGQVKIENIEGDGKILGAKLTIRLPT